MTLDNFIIPKKPIKRPRSDTIAPVEIHNKFQGLKEVTLKNVPVTHKLPPIYMKATTHSENLNTIKKYTNNFNLTYCGNGQVRIQTHTLEDFQKIKSGLKDNHTEYHSFTLKTDKPIKSVIRGLPILNVEEIKSDLIEKGFKVLNLFLLKGKNGLPTINPLYLINFEPGSNISAIKNLNILCHCKISIERYITSKHITQCHRCQQYGHASNNCNRQFKCLKCAEPHQTSDCIKNKEEPAKCINCQGDHTANFSGCPAKLKYLERTKKTPVTMRSEAVQPSPSMPTRPTPISSSDRRTWSQVAKGTVSSTPAPVLNPGFSWSQIVSGSMPLPRPTPVRENNINSADMPIGDLMQLVLKVRQLQLNLKSCRTPEERMMLIFEMAATLENV